MILRRRFRCEAGKLVRWWWWWWLTSVCTEVVPTRKPVGIRNSMCSKDVLKLADHCCCSRGVKSDDFQPSGIVVNHHHIVLVLEGKEIRP